MSGRKPFFSVITPALNEEKYLPRLLKSLTGQFDRDFEVIVVDGKSEDRTVEKAKSFGRRLSLKVVPCERNLSLQRNLGAEAAGGKWLVFLDADVKVPANFLSEAHNYLLKNPRARFLTVWAEPDSKKKSDKVLVTAGNLVMEMANSLDKPLVLAACMIINKIVFWRVGGFDEKSLPPKRSESDDLARRLFGRGVRPQVLRGVKVEVSLRRFRKEGTLNTLGKYAMLTFLTYLNAPLTKKLFDFEMGGRAARKKRNGLSDSLRKYSGKIKEALWTEFGQM